MATYENPNVGDKYRKEYRVGIERLIEERGRLAIAERARFAEEIKADRDEYREKFRSMLGWPLTEPHSAELNVRSTPVCVDWDYDITRMEFEVFPDLWFYGILFRHRDDGKRQNGRAFCDGGKRPFIISQHGGGGTPELCSGLFGNSVNYNGMTERLLALGADVFAPQLLIWNMAEDNDEDCVFRCKGRIGYDNTLKQLGGSVTALEIYCIERVLDYFEKQDFVDPEKIAMTGLSYGGFYTLFASACDTRIRRALASSQFNDRFEYNWSDWTWFNSGNTFTDAEIALLILPRQLTLCVGTADSLFSVDKAKEEYERLLGYMSEEERKHVEFIAFSGEHEYITDDEVLKRALFDGWM